MHSISSRCRCLLPRSNICRLNESHRASDKPGRIPRSTRCGRGGSDPPTLELATSRNARIANAAGPARSPSASSSPPISCVAEIAMAPDFSRPVAVAVELLGELRNTVRAHAGRRLEAERIAQPVGDHREPDEEAQQRLRPWREHLIERTELRNDEGRRCFKHVGPGTVSSCIEPTPSQARLCPQLGSVPLLAASSTHAKAAFLPDELLPVEKQCRGIEYRGNRADTGQSQWVRLRRSITRARRIRRGNHKTCADFLQRLSEARAV